MRNLLTSLLSLLHKTEGRVVIEKPVIGGWLAVVDTVNGFNNPYNESVSSQFQPARLYVFFGHHDSETRAVVGLPIVSVGNPILGDERNCYIGYAEEATTEVLMTSTSSKAQLFFFKKGEEWWVRYLGVSAEVRLARGRESCYYYAFLSITGGDPESDLAEKVEALAEKAGF